MDRSYLGHLYRGAIPPKSVAPAPIQKQEPHNGIKVAQHFLKHKVFAALNGPGNAIPKSPPFQVG
jgi:hypothetical protein